MFFGLFSSSKTHVSNCGYCEINLSFDHPKAPQGPSYKFNDFFIEFARIPCPNCKREQVILYNKEKNIFRIYDIKWESDLFALEEAIDSIETKISDIEFAYDDEDIDKITFKKTIADLIMKRKKAENKLDIAEEKYEDKRFDIVERTEEKFS